MSTYVSVIHSDFRQKRLKVGKADMFEIVERSVIFSTIKTTYLHLQSELKILLYNFLSN